MTGCTITRHPVSNNTKSELQRAHSGTFARYLHFHPAPVISRFAKTFLRSPLATMQLKLSQRPAAVGARASRRACVRVDAKVSKKEGEPRVIRGKCFVTKDVSVTAGR